MFHIISRISLLKCEKNWRTGDCSAMLHPTKYHEIMKVSCENCIAQITERTQIYGDSIVSMLVIALRVQSTSSVDTDFALWPHYTARDFCFVGWCWRCLSRFRSHFEWCDTFFLWRVSILFTDKCKKKPRSATAPVEPASFRSEIKKRSCKFITLLKCYWQLLRIKNSYLHNWKLNVYEHALVRWREQNLEILLGH